MDDHEVKAIEYKGYKIKVYQDENPMNPREWDNLGTMACKHSRYELGDKHTMTTEELIDLSKRDDMVTLPLYLYDHSGIWMSTKRDYPFNCRWDSGKVGFIFVSRSDIFKEYSRKHMSAKLKAKVRKVLEAEVETYSQYISGEAYGYVIEDSEGNDVDSVWGFYGDPEDYMIPEARNIVDHLSKVLDYQI